MTQPYGCSTAHIVIAWVVAALTLGYMLPWAIAATRNKSNTAVIALINALLGWSLVGWIVALVMSVSSEPQPVVYVNTAIMPPPYPAYGDPAARGPAQAPMLPPAPPAPPAYPNQWTPPNQQPNEPTRVLPYDQDPWGQQR